MYQITQNRIEQKRTYVTKYWETFDVLFLFNKYRLFQKRGILLLKKQEWQMKCLEVYDPPYFSLFNLCRQQLNSCSLDNKSLSFIACSLKRMHRSVTNPKIKFYPQRFCQRVKCNYTRTAACMQSQPQSSLKNIK